MRQFTLVELMVAIAIAMTLAAVAIPTMAESVTRAKEAEVPTNADGVQTALIAYDASHDGYLTQVTYVPDATPSKELRPWPSGTSFDELAWSPDGEVRGSYRIVAIGADTVYVGTADPDQNGELFTCSGAAPMTAACFHGNPPSSGGECSGGLCGTPDQSGGGGGCGGGSVLLPN